MSGFSRLKPVAKRNRYHTRLWIEKLEPRQFLSVAAAVPQAAAVTASLSAKQVEYLDRGLIAFYRGSGNVYMSWRLLGNEPSDIAFNVYRSTNGGTPVKRNASPITATTDYTDTGITTTNAYTYTIRPIVGGVEQAASKGYTVGPSPSANQYLSIPLSPPAPMTTPDGVVHTYEAKDASVGRRGWRIRVHPQVGLQPAGCLCVLGQHVPRRVQTQRHAPVADRPGEEHQDRR
jgi:hypothetical protein